MTPARRTVLGMMAGASGALLLPFGAAAAALSDERRALAALERLFSDPRAIRVVGRVCRQHSDMPTVRALAADLGTTVGDLATLDRAVLRRRLDRRLRADFAAGRVASIDGWVLSRTEARLYALIAAG